MNKTRVQHILEAVRRYREVQNLIEGLAPFLIFRADTGAVLEKGVYGYEAAKEKANELRKRLGLNWEQVKFKADRSSSTPPFTRTQASSFAGVPRGTRIDYSRRYNPSKRGRFRGYYDKDGNYHDID
jgi:hypothetical protein